MKVLHVCETVKGGTATYLNELIPLLLERADGVHIRLLMPREHAAQIPDVDAASLIFFTRPSRGGGVFRLLVATFSALRRFRPDIVHAHSTFAGVAVRLLGPLFGAKIIYCPHGWAMDREQNSFKKKTISLIEYGLSFFCDRIIAISDYERNRGIQAGISADKILTIHNGLHMDIPDYAPVLWEDKRLKVLFIGRLDRQKGVDILLKAIAPLSETVSVRVIGSAVTSDADIDFSPYPHVDYLGWKSASEVAAQMAACDVVVMPSRWEGFGLVAVEAMRLSKPVIAAKVGGLSEVVVDGETGLLFSPIDPESLRRTILLADRDGLKEMGQRGYKRFLEKFTSERMADEIMTVY